MEALLAGQRRSPKTVPFAHDRLPDIGAVLLGKSRPPFSGTDTLPMNVARVAEAWLERQGDRLVLGEGDRLAYDGFFKTASDNGYRVRILNFEVRDAQAQLRREIRAAENGLKLQNFTWVKGRTSKAQRLASNWDAVPIDANGDLESVALEVLRAVPELECRPR